MPSPVAHFKKVQNQLGDVATATRGKATFEYKSWEHLVNLSGKTGRAGFLNRGCQPRREPTEASHSAFYSVQYQAVEVGPHGHLRAPKAPMALIEFLTAVTDNYCSVNLATVQRTDC